MSSNKKPSLLARDVYIHKFSLVLSISIYENDYSCTHSGPHTQNMSRNYVANQIYILKAKGYLCTCIRVLRDSQNCC